MLTVRWNPHCFHVVTMFPPVESFNASYFIDQNLVPLVQSFFPSGWNPTQKELMVRVDNAPTRNSRMTRNFVEHDPPKRLPHPPYSPDISPSDLYRFGKVKEVLIGQGIPDEIMRLYSVTEILNGISTDELQRVFRSWIKPIENVIPAEWGYASW
jgi:histone-lysine N-methyltransferase SETMAR